MRKFVLKSLLFTALLASLLGGIGGLILFGLPPQFDNTYQHALYLQVQALSRIRSPKVVVMGDSAVPFSLDCAEMSKIMKEPVQTLGIHSGTGTEYLLNLSESSIRRGDIMVLELPSDAEDNVFSPAIVLTASENHFDMYRGFTPDEWGDAARYYPTFLIKKVKYCVHDRDRELPSYSIDSFDGNGNYDYRRTGCRLPVHLQADERTTEFSRKDYSDQLIGFLNNYDLFCVKQGATFLVSFSPFLNESLAGGQNGFSDVQSYLSERLKAPVITRIGERELPRRYFYDNVTHCNTAGAEKVTEDLANDILSYLKRGAPKTVALGKPGLKISVRPKQTKRTSLREAPSVRPAKVTPARQNRQKKIKPV